MTSAERPLRFNADFELVLQGLPPKPSLNATLEFFLFWLEPAPVRTHREYPENYLRYVEALAGQRPRIVKAGEARDWWGSLDKFELARDLNSKASFADWLRARGRATGIVCRRWEELVAAVGEGEYLAKKSDGMSGRGHVKVRCSELEGLRSRFDFRTPVVVEPLYARVRDVSALWLPDEERFIYYSNAIDSRFQWRSTTLDSDAFDAAPEGSGDWRELLAELQQDMHARGYAGHFSVDAFFYQRNHRTHFHPGSEVNARRTMGLIAYLFAKRSRARFFRLALVPAVITGEAWEKLSRSPHARLLSPERNPFVWFAVEADSHMDLEAKAEAFLRELPGARAPGKA